MSSSENFAIVSIFIETHGKEGHLVNNLLSDSCSSNKEKIENQLFETITILSICIAMRAQSHK